MRRPLAAIEARVDRLLAQAGPPALVPVERMNDDELDGAILEIVQRLTGSIRRFKTLEEWVGQYCSLVVGSGLPPDDDGVFASVMRRHWERVH